jgi:uncharacterized protein
MRIPRPFSRLPALAILALTLVVATALMGVAQLFPESRRLTESPMGAMLVVYLGIVLVLLGMARFASLDWNRLLGPTLPHTEWQLASVAFPLAAMSYGGFWLFWVPLSYVIPGVVQSYALEGMPDLLSRNDPARLFLDIVGITVVAPVVEEILFRGFLLHRFAARWGTTAGIIVSSAFFAILHVELIGHFLFGVAMCALYIRSRSLWLPILAHAVNNAFALSFAFPDALGGAPEAPATIQEFRAEWPTGLVALALGAAGLMWFWRRFAPHGAWTLPYAVEVPVDDPIDPIDPVEPQPADAPVGGVS